MHKNIELARKIDRTAVQFARFLRKELGFDSPIPFLSTMVSAEAISELAGMRKAGTSVIVINSIVYCHPKTPANLRFRGVWGRNVRFMASPSHPNTTLKRPNFYGSNLPSYSDFSGIKLEGPLPYIPPH